MDGAFWKDFITNLPLGHIKEFAIDYYIKYPALTVLYYPQLFPMVEAGFFALFGVSNFSAQLTVAAFYLFAAWGAFVLARFYLPSWQAFAVSLLFIGGHEVAFWGRQVMLDIPCYAFLLWSVYVLLRYLDSCKAKFLYLLVIIFTAGLYTKQSIIFIAPIFLWIIWRKNGWQMTKSPHLWGAISLFILIVSPLVFLTFKFGSFNIGLSVGSLFEKESPRFSLKGWLFYLKIIPRQIGWITAALAALFLAVSAWRRKWRLPKLDHELFLSWFIWGYVFFSLLRIKETRHSIFILFPLVLFAVIALNRLLPSKTASLLGLILGIANFSYVIFYDPVTYVQGYREASDFIATSAPPDSVILFSGYMDGAFIFDVRSHEERRDLTVLRADKLLFKYAIYRELLEERDLTQQQIVDMINKYGVYYVVSEPNFWIDLKAMRLLQKILHSPQFKEIARIPISSNWLPDKEIPRIPMLANWNFADKELIIYQNTSPITKNKAKLKLDLPAIGTAIEGAIK